jgi:hypothetical protein
VEESAAHCPTPPASRTTKGIEGNNLSTGIKIAVGAGLAASVVMLFVRKVVIDDE